MHNYKYFSHTHAQVHADNTYVHVNKYIHIPVHTYRDIQKENFQTKNIFTVKNCSNAHIIHTQTHAER
jgi:hypothetical protein